MRNHGAQVVDTVAFNYLSYTLQIHDHLMELRRILRPYQDAGQVAAWIAEVDRLNEKLENMRFQVAVVGEFKRGKTSFINALLRKQILPADVVPATATINRITYGDVPASYIQWKDGRPNEKIEIEALSDYITKLTDSAAMQARSIKEAVVRYPCRFCEHNVDLIDTPGMNDDDAMNDVTIQQLSGIDLAIVTLDPNFPVSATEAAFIAQLVESRQICRIVFVASKIDTVPERQRERLLEVIRQRLRTCVEEVLLQSHEAGDEIMDRFREMFSEIVLFPVSATQALYAYELGDQQVLEDSGFQRLNDELLPLIIRTQHSAAILTPVHTMAQISRQLRCLLEGWAARTERERTLTALKRRFAECAYRQHVDPQQLWQSCAGELDRQRERWCTEVFDSIMAALGQPGGPAALLPHIKGLFQRLNGELSQEESGAYREVWASHLAPVYGSLKGELLQMIQTYPALLAELAAGLDALDRFEPAAGLFPSPEPFYWETSPIPPDTMPRGQMSYFVDRAVRASFESYYQRRQARLSQYLRGCLEAQEGKAEELVRLLFQCVRPGEAPDGFVPLEWEEYRSVERDLERLDQRCAVTKEDYVRHMEQEE